MSWQLLFQFAALFSNWIGLLLSLFFAPSASPHLSLSDACFSNSRSLIDLAECLEKFTVLKGTYNHFTYIEAQPTVAQRDAWFKATQALLYTDNNCSASILPPAIQDIYSIDLFTENNGKSFCVLYERTVDPCSELYEKGWGFAMVPASRAGVSRLVHISAPHPFFDGETTVEAAQIFQETGSKSLLVPGRMRNAFYAPSPCVQPSSNSSIYYVTDPAHNDVSGTILGYSCLWCWPTYSSSWNLFLMRASQYGIGRFNMVAALRPHAPSYSYMERPKQRVLATQSSFPLDFVGVSSFLERLVFIQTPS